MKILQIATLFPLPWLPQYGIFIKEQYDALTEMGCDVSLLAVVNSKTYNKIQDKQIGNVRYINFDNVLPGAFNLWISGFSLAKKIERELKDEIKLYDIIHGHETLPCGFAAAILSHKYHIKSVVSVHGLDAGFKLNTNSRILSFPNRQVCKWVYKKSNIVIGVSNRVCSETLQVEKNANVKTVYNGVNLENFFKKEKKVKNTFNIICVGNYIGLKRIEDLLESIAILPNSVKIHCEIFGKGYLEKNLISLASRLNIEDRVLFRGYQPVSVIADAMQQADLFVLPSEYEAFGCVYVEAMACGVPVIACEGQGISELIQDGKNGFLVPTRSPEKIAYYIKYAIDNPNKLSQVSNNALRTAQEYTWKKSASDLFKIYLSLTGLNDNE